MNVLRLLIAVLVIAAIGWLVWWDRAHPQVSFLSGFLAAQIPSLLALVLIGYRSRFLTDNLISFPVALRGNALAVAGTLLLPARLGDFGKPFYFNALSKYSIPKGLTLVVEERIWDFVVLAMLTVGTLFYIGDNANSAALAAASRVSAMIAIIGLAILVFLPKFASHLPILRKIEEKYAVFAGRSWQRMLGTLLISMLIWSMSVATLIAAYKYSGLPELRFEQLIFLFVAATLGLVISVTPGSIGTYEGVIVGVLVSYGVKWDAALAFAIGFRICWLAAPIVAAIVALMSDGKTIVNRRKQHQTQQ